MAMAVDFASSTRHRIAVRLLPFLFILYIINYIDRTNLAYAAIGMSRDLGFGDRVFGLGAGIFFVSYVGLQVTGPLLVERWSARRMISVAMIAWGSLTILTALVHTPMQLYGARFLLGAAEAGFFPGVVVYLSHWFIEEDRAKAMSNFMAAIPLSSALGSPLAGWILAKNWLGVGGWRWLFVLEGLPAMVLGGLAFFLLTDWPQEAHWLRPEERRWIQHRLHRDPPAPSEAVGFFRTLSSPAVFLLSLVPFFSYFMTYSFTFWFPTILKRESGSSDMRVGLIGAIPFLGYFLAMQVIGWHSDRTQERRWHAAVPLFMAAAALLVLLAVPHSLPSLLLLFTIVGIGASYLPIFWAIPTETLPASLAPTAIGIINATGSIAGFAGPYTFGYLYARSGSYWSGIVLMMIAGVVAGLLVFCTPRKRAAEARS